MLPLMSDVKTKPVMLNFHSFHSSLCINFLSFACILGFSNKFIRGSVNFKLNMFKTLKMHLEL